MLLILMWGNGGNGNGDKKWEEMGEMGISTINP